MNIFKPSESTINNYIQNKLTDAESEQVEFWLADNPEALEDLQYSVMFKQGILSHSEEQEEVQLFWWQVMLQKRALALSYAAFFALGIIMSNVVLNRQSENIISNPNVSMLSQMRGSETKPILSNANDLLLQMPVDYLSEGTYSVVITGNKGFSFKLNKIMSESDIVSVLISKTILVRDDYQLILLNDNSKDESLYYFVIK